MTDDYDRDSWERRWSQALRDHGDQVARRPPNAHLLAEVGDLEPGCALDAGCGHGAEAIWLAASGWRVTAVDFSVTALEHARSTAGRSGRTSPSGSSGSRATSGAGRRRPGRFDLVSCLYVHVAGSVGEMVTRLGGGVAPGGTLVLVGHQPVDPETGAPTPAAGQVQVSVDDAARGARHRRLAGPRRRGAPPGPGRRGRRCRGAGGLPTRAGRALVGRLVGWAP